MTRKYELKRRAESQAATRKRIIEATVELHDSVGFGATISAIAERAGVQRLTVYRHFPDERTLVEACADHWRAQNPVPDPSAWAAVAAPDERLRIALTAIYAFFRRTEGMTANLRAGLADSPVLQEVAAPLIHYWQTVRKTLERDWRTQGSQRTLLRAVIGHALDFETWRSLTRQQDLSDADAADLMVRLARTTGRASRP